jgi:general secretion pathway protein G
MDLHPTRRRPRRSGFTLIELLVVIVIIGILASLLAPAIFGAIRTARDAAVIAEINSMGNSLASFHDRYGEYAPSRIILSENGFYATDTGNAPGGGAISGIAFYGAIQPTPAGDADLLYGQLAQRSLRALRKMFPRVTFSTTGPLAASPATAADVYDFNGNFGITSTIYDGAVSSGGSSGGILAEGDEALPFFLGGIPSVDANGPIGMSGFSKNPQNPFINDTATQSRDKSFFEFRGERLYDFDGDGMPSYLDTLGTGTDGRPYAYFVSHPGIGYDPNDCNLSADANGVVYQTFNLGFSVSNGNLYTTSPGPNPYTSSLPAPTTGTSLRTASFINQNTFQIISAGRDRDYGAGGQYLPSGVSGKLPAPPADRLSESDNLTNFATQKLE